MLGKHLGKVGTVQAEHPRLLIHPKGFGVMQLEILDDLPDPIGGRYLVVFNGERSALQFRKKRIQAGLQGKPAYGLRPDGHLDPPESLFDPGVYRAASNRLLYR